MAFQYVLLSICAVLGAANAGYLAPTSYVAAAPVLTKSVSIYAAAPAPAVTYAAPAPVLAKTVSYAAPAVTYSAPAPVLAKTVSYAAPAPVLAKTYAAPVASYAAPLAAPAAYVKYSPAIGVAHVSFDGFGSHWGY
ncbi:PREDICTED: pupal cuticle protein G1A isoform X2 [Drosophila arizonae]|uniref:Pupal cuticle protein G1A isoform X2 n=1 Tax=Drosophila arizonae TaxID=7263 RepID=A0ABM1P9Y0_DROAR|nr:PREDICTED: pupal cuticle protein G1A isoform X2 [Drosophila arizonae]